MSAKKAAVVMQTDFTKDISVCTMQGVCMMVDPELRVFDNTHEIKNFDTYQASTALSYVVDFWPAGTVFVSVVDPGVGTDRRACVAKLKNGSYVVTPDNGTLTHVNKYVGIEEVRVIDEERNRLKSTAKCHIFHGRDLFAYCAAKLASGKITYEEVGEAYPIEEIVLHELYRAEVANGDVTAMIQGYDPFGSAELSVRNEQFVQAGFQLGEMLKVSVYEAEKCVLDREILYERSFGYVPKGEDVLFQDLASFVTIAANEANFKRKYGLCEEKAYRVRIQRVN